MQLSYLEKLLKSENPKDRTATQYDRLLA